MSESAKVMRSFVEELASEAAEIAFAGYRTGVSVEKKGVIDLLTEYDLAAEAHIRKRIEARFPTHRIVGEEDGESGAGEDIWYVDPIDGTTNFVHGHPFFCCSIAYYHGGEAVAGAVVAPALGTTWSAGRDLGATRNGQPCKVSETAALGDALCATGFPYDRWTNDDNNRREFVHLLQKVRGIRRCGSAALDLCLVADGTYDAYWEQRLSPWDMCAGALIAHEAGGRLSDYDGAAADPREGRIVVSGGSIHDALIAELRVARATF